MYSTTPISKSSVIYPAASGGTSTSATALINAGVGVFGDAATRLPTSTAGMHFLDVHEATGLELHFVLAGSVGETATARVFRAFPVMSAQQGGTVVQWTYRHLCDLTLTASSQAYDLSGLASDATKGLRWASAVVNSDAGLSPSGTRTMNGTTTTAAGSVIIDPVCAPIIIVQTCIGTADSVTLFASDWTGM